MMTTERWVRLWVVRPHMACVRAEDIILTPQLRFGRHGLGGATMSALFLWVSGAKWGAEGKSPRVSFSRMEIRGRSHHVLP